MAKQVTVGWVDPVDTTNADHIEVWRKTGVGGTYAQIGTDLALGVQTYVDQNGGSGLADSTDYYYDVRVYNSSGEYVSTLNNIVISGAGDTTAPTVSSFVIANGAATTGVITFSEAVLFPDVTGLSMTGDFADITLSSPTGSGTTWNVTLSRAAVNGETGNFVYGATNTITDTSSNALAASSTAVTNNVAADQYILNMDGLTDKVLAPLTFSGSRSEDTTLQIPVGGYVEFKVKLNTVGDIFTFLGLTTGSGKYAQIQNSTGVPKVIDPNNTTALIGTDAIDTTNWSTIRFIKESTGMTFVVNGNSYTRVSTAVCLFEWDKLFARATSTASTYDYEFSTGSIEYIDFNGDMMVFSDTGAQHSTDSGDITMTIQAITTIANLFTLMP